MGKITFTDEQTEVIRARESNLLVSAAAGSGKTAVLVERIIDRLADQKAPISLDRLLVMTFTRAAAEGMKQKIGDALEERIGACQTALDRMDQADPGYQETLALWQDLKSQEAMLPRARIATIDSIFQTLIRQYFQDLDIDPSFRVADEAELKLLQGDIIKELLEEKYNEEELEFLRFSQAFSNTGLDERISDLILRTYQFVSSRPWPEDFLKQCEQDALREREGKVWETEWFKECLAMVKGNLERILFLLQKQISKAEEPDGWKPYLEDLKAAAELVRELKCVLDTKTGKEAYEGIRELTDGFCFPALSRKGCKESSEKQKAEALGTFNLAKEFVNELTGRYFGLSAKDMERSAAGSAADQIELIRLTLAFLERFTRKKRERSIVDFVDMEHLALQLLYTGQDGEYHPSALADELAQELDEILIDEYQDSNEVQEQLIYALSAERFGRPDVFMVGDVKQSIYSFRQARPELFMEKYRTYRQSGSPQGQAPGVRIELNKNFRSRSEVLETVNDVFSRVMQPQTGGISYDGKARLYPGRTEEQDPAYRTELMIAQTGGGEEPGLPADEAEAVMIAERILDLKDPQKKDPESSIPPFANKDITILVRSKSKAERMTEILNRFGIETVFDCSTGYFSSVEVTLMLSLLSVINNPCQDIPLAAVCKSIVGRFSDEELSLLRIRFGKTETGADRSLYELLECAAAAANDELCRKVLAFMEKLKNWRKASLRLPVHELIDRLYRETGYYHYAAAMPGGKKRRRNLDKLLEKAENYAATSYHGLFNFIRYIDQLKTYETEEGQAPDSDGEDVVHVTTIHKSKGLEYPVTIVAGMGRVFNTQDSRENLVMDDELGFACDYIDTEKRIRYPSMKAALIRRRAKNSQIGEELRVLYVAMTRAKEKLIMTASVSDYAKKEAEERTGADNVESSTSQLAFVLKSGVQKKDSLAVKVFENGTLTLPEKDDFPPVESIVKRNACEITEETAKEEERLKANIRTPYAHETETTLPPKVSVSQLKAKQITGSEFEFVHDLEERKETKGAEYGTIVHRAFEILDYSKEGGQALPDIAGVDENTMRSVRGIIDRFRETGLYERMKQAAQKGNLFREQHFMIGVPACELDPDTDSEELQLMQGIIDAYILDADGIELIDYKTDRVETEEKLVSRYALQLRLYARALEQLLRIPVKKCVIYSTCLNKEIEV